MHQGNLLTVFLSVESEILLKQSDVPLLGCVLDLVKRELLLPAGVMANRVVMAARWEGFSAMPRTYFSRLYAQVCINGFDDVLNQLCLDVLSVIACTIVPK